MVVFGIQVLSINPMFAVPCVYCAFCVAAKMRRGPGKQEYNCLPQPATLTESDNTKEGLILMGNYRICQVTFLRR